MPTPPDDRRSPRPPLLARLLLGALLPARHREFALGDLEEEFRRRSAGDAGAARRWFWTETARAAALAAARAAVKAARATAGAGSAWRTGDAGQAWKRVVRRPGRSATVALTLALGIASATTVFTATDAALLRPMDHERSVELYTVWLTYPRWRGHEVLDAHWDRVPLSWPGFEDWRDGQSALDGVAAFGVRRMTLEAAEGPRRIGVGQATPSLFPLLGTDALLGRTFLADEAGRAARPVALVSWELWRTRFGSDPDALGRTLRLDGRPYEVVGVLPRGFRIRPTGRGDSPARIDAWIPVGADGAYLERDNHFLEGIARLADGSDPVSARLETERLLRGDLGPDARGARLEPRRASLAAPARDVFVVVLAASLLLLLIACGNAAALVLADVSGRGRELATRRALGAGRGGVLRQVLLEGAFAAAAGGVAGVALARACLAVLPGLAPPELGLPPRLAPDALVLGLAVATTLATGTLVGLVPGWLVGRGPPAEALRGGGPGRGGVGLRYQRWIVGGQLALALVLLLGCGLLARSLGELLAVEPGFEPDGVAVARIALPADRREPAAAATLVRALRERLAALPGVASAGATSALPFTGSGGSTSFDVEGRETPPGQKKPEALLRLVTPGFHDALRIPLVEGRAFEPPDAHGPGVALVSRRLAAVHWPGRSPLGRTLVRQGERWRIVGVVGDVRHERLDAPPEPTLYLPLGRTPDAPAEIHLVARAADGATPLAGALRPAIAEVAADVPVDEVTTLATLLRRAAGGTWFRTALLGLFAGSALALSLLGLAAVVVRSVRAGSRELGVRMALGASRAALVRRAVGREAGAVVAGVAVGAAGARLGAEVLEASLFGVETGDPLAWALAVGGLGAAALVVARVAAARTVAREATDLLRQE